MSIRDIDPFGDFLLEITEVTEYDPKTHNVVTGIVNFRVSRKLIEEHSVHEFLANITSFDTNIDGMEIILKVIHGVFDFDTITGKTFDKESLTSLYNVLEIALLWFKTEELEFWFEKFWEDRGENELSRHALKVLLYPTYIFRHPEAFARVTKALVFEWNKGDIHGFNPLTGFPESRFEARILRQLTRIKTRILEREITNPLLDMLDHLCDSFCPARGECMLAYNTALRECLVFPSHARHNHSIQEILESDGMNLWKCSSPPNASGHCEDILSGRHVRGVKRDALNFWQGMCIDCVMRTSGPVQEQYWKDGQRGRYGKSCRLAHDYRTWSYSYMGPFELMSKHIAEQQSREKKASRSTRNDRTDHDQTEPSRREKKAARFAHNNNKDHFEFGPKSPAKPGSFFVSDPPTFSEEASFFASSPPPPLKKNRPVKFATPDDYALRQQQKIAEWTAKNLANIEATQAQALDEVKLATSNDHAHDALRQKENIAESTSKKQVSSAETQSPAAATYKWPKLDDMPREQDRIAEAAEKNRAIIARNHAQASAVVQHQTPVDEKQAPATQPQAPIVRQALVRQHQAPALQNQAPPIKHQAPATINSVHAPPVNTSSAPPIKRDWIAERLHIYNTNRAAAIAHQKMVNGETGTD